MKLGIVITVINGERVTGVERYALELIRHIPSELRGHITLFCSKNGEDVVRLAAGDEVKIVVSPFRNRILTDQVWLPWAIRKTSLEFIYNATLSYPFWGFGSTPFAIMVHDATPWRFPETISKGMKYYYLPQLRSALKSGNLTFVVTNSESSKRDLIEFCGIPQSIVYPIHLAVQPDDFGISEEITDIGRIVPSLDSPYILSVGTIEPRKNLSRTIEAFSNLAGDHPSLKLVLVGRKGWQKELPIPAQTESRVVFTGYVTQEHLAHLYSHASVFVFASIYEGFGFPLLEAMLSGTPVVASNTSSLPEIGGQACVYVDPYSVLDISNGIRKVLTDSGLREHLVRAGYKQVMNFSWKETMERTWNLLRDSTPTCP